jgi:hypothetical protein
VDGSGAENRPSSADDRIRAADHVEHDDDNRHGSDDRRHHRRHHRNADGVVADASVHAALFHFEGTITVPDVGDGTFTFDETVTNQPTVEGPITVTFGSGTLVGDLLVEMPAPNGTLPMQLTFTDGTGALAGATGQADGVITMISQGTFLTLDGSVAGSLEIP